MRFLKQIYEIMPTNGYDMPGIYKDIERAGRISYKSENLITEESSVPFVERMIKNRHGAVLEFGTVYLIIPVDIWTEPELNRLHLFDVLDKPWVSYNKNAYDESKMLYVTSNMRWIIENGLQELLDKYAVEPTEKHEMRYTVKFTTQRCTSHEIVRHRLMSQLMESQRYCAYNKKKFGSEVSFIIPCWLTDWINEDSYEKTDVDTYTNSNGDKFTFPSIETNVKEHIGVECFFDDSFKSERNYFKQLNAGFTPQQSRVSLTNEAKTELFTCGFASEWKEFFELRDVPSVDPQMYDLAKPLHEEFLKMNYYKSNNQYKFSTEFKKKI